MLTDVVATIGWEKINLLLERFLVTAWARESVELGFGNDVVQTVGFLMCGCTRIVGWNELPTLSNDLCFVCRESQ